MNSFIQCSSIELKTLIFKAFIFKARTMYLKSLTPSISLHNFIVQLEYTIKMNIWRKSKSGKQESGFPNTSLKIVSCTNPETTGQTDYAEITYKLCHVSDMRWNLFQKTKQANCSYAHCLEVQYDNCVINLDIFTH